MAGIIIITINRRGGGRGRREGGRGGFGTREVKVRGEREFVLGDIIVGVGLEKVKAVATDAQ